MKAQQKLAYIRRYFCFVSIRQAHGFRAIAEVDDVIAVQRPDLACRAEIAFCRGSTKKQAKEGNGLTSQETRCREYAQFRGHEVVSVFTDDVSSKLAQRPGFDDMLAFLRKNRKLGLVVIIDDISRMARDVRNHFDFKESIFRAGATLESPSIEFGMIPTAY